MAEHGGRREGSGRKRVVPEQATAPVDKGIATRVLAKPYKRSDGTIVTEDLAWEEILYGKDEDRALRARIYLTDKRDGKPAQGVFVGDTRESTRELDLGNLPMPASPKSGTAGKPN